MDTPTKKISETIEKEIRDNQILVVVISNTVYFGSLKELVDILSRLYKNICYVSLNKPANTIIDAFNKHKIDTKNFYFIDCMSKTIVKQKASRIFYVTSPAAFTELSITINNVLDLGDIEVTIFDSLSTLLIYEEPMNTIRFAQQIMARLRAANTKGVFSILKEDSKTDMMKDLNMFADKIITLEG